MKNMMKNAIGFFMMSKASIPPGLVSGWTNIDFTSLTSSGLDITDAIAGGGGYQKIRTNWFHLSEVDALNYSFNFNLISGAYPYLIFFKNNTNAPFYAGFPLTKDGLTAGSCLIDEEADYAIGFVSLNGATEFNIDSLVAY
jgi:hypothetical protein